MKSTHKCLKEWNATIEALGQGKQTILIRSCKTNFTEFLLYPTVVMLFGYEDPVKIIILVVSVLALK